MPKPTPDRRKDPLFRSVNTRTHGVRHGGGDYSWSRHVARDDPTTLGSMHGGQRHGRDYTPLYRFLVSRVGRDWAEIHSEAVSRLDRAEPISHIVAASRDEGAPFIRVGESAYVSGLYVDDENRLRLVAPDLTADDMEPSCACCTHTFNGKPFTRKFQAP